MKELLLGEYHQDNVTIVTVEGELDIGTGPSLYDRLTALIVTGHHRIILDIPGLTFCDAYGLSILLKARTQVHDNQGWLRLLAPRPNVQRVLRISRLTKVLSAFDTLAEAIDGTRPDLSREPISTTLKILTR